MDAWGRDGDIEGAFQGYQQRRDEGMVFLLCRRKGEGAWKKKKKKFCVLWKPDMVAGKGEEVRLTKAPLQAGCTCKAERTMWQGQPNAPKWPWIEVAKRVQGEKCGLCLDLGSWRVKWSQHNGYKKQFPLEGNTKELLVFNSSISFKI